MFGGAFAALALAAVALTPAFAKPDVATTEVGPHDTAIKACSAVNPLQPVEVVNAVEDGSGVGFSLVWLTDKAGNLWMCDADADGYVYTYSLVTGDILDGAGPEMIGLQEADFAAENPQEIAEKVCVAYLTDGGEVVGSFADGFENDPGYLIFIETDAGELYLCDATGDAMIWAFEPVGDPLSFGDQETA
jgi:hypothetical protein